MGDQREQVGAVHRRVGEAITLPVPVRVEPPPQLPTTGHSWQVRHSPVDSLLAGQDAGMPSNGVEGMVEDVHPGLRGAVVSHFQRVHLLVAAVGLDDHETGRSEPQGLGKAFTAAQRGEDRIEGPDPRPGGRPRASGRRSRSASPHTQLSAARRGARRMIPGRVGQQEIDPGRPQVHQGLIDHQRVVSHVDGA